MKGGKPKMEASKGRAQASPGLLTVCPAKRPKKEQILFPYIQDGVLASGLSALSKDRDR